MAAFDLGGDPGPGRAVVEDGVLKADKDVALRRWGKSAFVPGWAFPANPNPANVRIGGTIRCPS